MDDVIGDILPLALTIALVPLSIIGLVLLLFTRRARTNATAFTTGRIVGLTVVVVIALSLAAGHDPSTHGSSSPVRSLIKVAAGVVLVLGSVWRWRRHREPSEEPSLPRWMQRLEQATPVLSLSAGFLISVLEPLTVAFAVDAGVSIAQAELPVGSSVVVVVVFIVVATVTNTGLLAIYLAGGTTAEEKFGAVKRWLVVNHTTVSMAVLLILGIVLIGRGAPGIGG
jgi:threonine/homoserine/homoserine lactone efflux protein